MNIISKTNTALENYIDTTDDGGGRGLSTTAFVSEDILVGFKHS